MCGMSGISGMFSPDLLFLPPANSRALGGFIPLIPHIPHPSGETASRSQSLNLLTDTQIAGYDMSAIYEAGTARLPRTLRAILIDTTRKAFRDDTPEERAARLEQPWEETVA